MRLMSLACSRWKLTDLELVAGNNRTGIETSPKVRLAVDIERAGMVETSARSQRESYRDPFPRECQAMSFPGLFPGLAFLYFATSEIQWGSEINLIEDYR